MIEIYSGIPGSGKSYCATSRAVRALKKGRPVFSNYPIRYKDKVSYRLEKNMIKDGVFPQGSLVVIDEAGSWFNSRDWKSFTMDDFILFTQHRHMAYDMILCSQHPARIDTVVREISNVFWWWKNYFFFFLGTGYYEYSDIGSRDRDIPKRGKIVLKSSVVNQAYDTHFYSHLLKGRNDVPFDTWDVPAYVGFIQRLQSKCIQLKSSIRHKLFGSNNSGR